MLYADSMVKARAIDCSLPLSEATVARRFSVMTGGTARRARSRLPAQKREAIHLATTGHNALIAAMP